LVDKGVSDEACVKECSLPHFGDSDGDGICDMVPWKTGMICGV
jgi:hypothetical protein